MLPVTEKVRVYVGETGKTTDAVIVLSAVSGAR